MCFHDVLRNGFHTIFIRIFAQFFTMIFELFFTRFFTASFFTHLEIFTGQFFTDPFFTAPKTACKRLQQNVLMACLANEKGICSLLS